MTSFHFCSILILTAIFSCLDAAASRAGDFSTEYQRETAARFESLSPETLTPYRQARRVLAERRG